MEPELIPIYDENAFLKSVEMQAFHPTFGKITVWAAPPAVKFIFDSQTGELANKDAVMTVLKDAYRAEVARLTAIPVAPGAKKSADSLGLTIRQSDL